MDQKHSCEFCNNTFITKAVLSNHKKNAKYCIEIQKKINNENINGDLKICKFCNKTFSSSTLKRHEDTCKVKKENILEQIINELNEQKLITEKYRQEIFEHKQKIIELEIENKNCYKQIDEKNHQIDEKNLKIEKLENIIAKIAEKPTNNITTTNNNNNKYNQIIQNLVPLKPEDYFNLSDNLTYNHIKNEFDGYYVDLTYDFLKNKAICTDITRKMFKYKDENGDIKSDPKMTKLAQEIFTSIHDMNYIYLEKYKEELTEEGKKKCDKLNKADFSESVSINIDIQQITDKIENINNCRDDITDIVNGKDNEYRSKYVDKVASKLYVKN